jgi:hypothetical protein
LNEAPAESVSSSFHKTRLREGNIGLSNLKISWDVAIAFLTEAALMGFPCWTFYTAAATITPTSASFPSFWSFFVFNSFAGMICLNDRQGLVPKRLVDQQFFFR